MLKKASLKRLQFCNFKLDSLLGITQAINDNLSTEKLLERYEKILTDELNIGKLLVFKNDEDSWATVVEAGFEKGKYDYIRVERDLLPYDGITTTFSTLNKRLVDFDIIIPVFHNNSGLAYVLIGDIDQEKAGISPTIKHLSFIQTLTNVIIVAIENKRLFKENLRREAMKKEMEVASKMQAMLIPSPDLLPKNEKIFFDAYYLPHLEIGGDYYDVIKLNNDEFGFCIADVSGKGTPAALLMSNFQANLKALFSETISLSNLINLLNDKVINIAHGDRFITLFVAKYNFKTRILNYVNAGHNPPVMYDTKKGTRFLRTGSIGIGMLDEIPKIREGQMKLETGTKLLCYTDGLVELKSHNQIESGMKTLEDSISDTDRIDKSLEKIIDKLEIDKNNESFFDDISILGIEFF